MWGVRALTLLALLGASSAEETATAAPSATTPLVSPTSTEAVGDKIARRIIDDRLAPPRVTEYSPWNKRLPAGEVHRPGGAAPPSVTEEVDETSTERGVPKKIRTIGSPPDPGCCGGAKPGGPVGFSDKDKPPATGHQGSEATDLGGAGPAARFHGNRPNDDRYNNGGHGWRTSSYLGFGKDKGYYDQRNQYPYDRYSTAQRPGSSYSIDGDRFGTVQRPGSSYGGADGDRYGSGTVGRPSSSYPSANYGYGGGGSSYADRPRPGVGAGGAGGNYGISGSIGEGDSPDYPYPEGGPPTGPPTNLQTQKAVALKALAGVALIGAAAALASNPVLLPISVISGRRKRSVQVESDNYALTALLQGYIQPKPNEVAGGRSEGGGDEKASSGGGGAGPIGNGTTTAAHQELVISPQCVARLACHVHRDYLDELEKSRAELAAATAAGGSGEGDEAGLRDLEHWFDSLVRSNILIADYLSDELKSLIQSAVTVGSDKNATCDAFSCLNVRDSSSKKKTTPSPLR